MPGYLEHEHTADWELEAWAADLPGLFEQAARGMYALSGVQLLPGVNETRSFTLRAQDAESLLVRFLGELLFYAQQENLGFDGFALVLIQPAPGELLELRVTVEGLPLLSVDKEIKAVTYHNLAVRQEAGELHVRIVFDV